MAPGLDPPVRPGEVLAGKYRVERILGAGGMGVVVAAIHLELGERRAVKFMLPSGADDTVQIERFAREARAAASLKSEHVARVFDVGRMESGAPYIVMEYLEGTDLGRLIKQGGPLPVAQAVDYILQVCDALAEAHAAGIIHRDLKPANLFLSADADGSSRVKVLDFGISKLTTEAAASEITGTDAMIGSPFHMSPEQMRSSRDVDRRTDIWSLGVILYQLLTGAFPFEGDTRYAVMMAVGQDVPTAPSAYCPALPKPLEEAVLRCLEKDRNRRFADVHQLALALSPFTTAPESTLRLARIARLVARGHAGVVPQPGAALVSTDGTGASAGRSASLGRGEGHTEASWGKTGGGRRAARPSRFLPYAAVAVAAIAAGVVGARGLVSTSAAPASAGSNAPAGSTASSFVGSAAVALPETHPSASPATSAPDPAVSGVEPAPSASAATPADSSSARAARAGAPHAPPSPRPPPIAAPPPSDPWGNARK